MVIFIHGFRGDYSREVFALMRSGDLHDLGSSMIISYRNDLYLRIHQVFFNMGLLRDIDCINEALNTQIK